MAQVAVGELIEAVERDPRYERWEMDVPARESLYLTFRSDKASSLKSTVFDAVDGTQIVLDVGPDGRVYGIQLT